MFNGCWFRQDTSRSVLSLCELLFHLVVSFEMQGVAKLSVLNGYRYTVCVEKQPRF